MIYAMKDNENNDFDDDGDEYSNNNDQIPARILYAFVYRYATLYLCHIYKLFL